VAVQVYTGSLPPDVFVAGMWTIVIRALQDQTGAEESGVVISNAWIGTDQSDTGPDTPAASYTLQDVMFVASPDSGNN
jgi:hypothetical protein